MTFFFRLSENLGTIMTKYSCQEKWADAVERYRDVMRSAEEHRARIKTDTLQRLHTVTNLAELLEAGHPGVSPTMRDTELRPLASELRSHYMNR